MRTRTRTPPNPPNGASGIGTPKDTFTDEPKGRGWKPASRTSFQILESNKLVVNAQASSNGGVTWQPWELKRAPFYWAGEAGITGVVHEPIEALNPNPFQPIDLVSMAIDRSRSDLFLLDFLREGADTVRMLRKPWRFLQHMKKTRGVVFSHDQGRSLGNLKSAINTAGSTWLEGTYGYIPFMHDLYAISEICSNPLGILESCAGKPLVTDVRQSFSETVSSTKPDLSLPAYDRRICVSKTQVHSGKRLVRIRWVYNPSYGALSMARQISSFLGLSDFGRLSLEAVKLSFVGDWFSSFWSRVASHPGLNGPVMWATTPWTFVSKSEKIVTFYGRPYLNNVTSSTSYKDQRVSGGSATTISKVFYRGGQATESIDSYTNNTDGLSAWRTTSGTFLALGELKKLF